jgi:YHS domain-containing protein/thiol-disulfide isomerase/thioredoxin
MQNHRCGPWVMVLAGVLAGWPASAAAQSGWHADLDQARAEAERLNRPILVHFGASWCAPCQKMERSVFNQRSVIDQLQNAVVGLKVDVDKQPQLARRFGVDRFPTDVVLEPNGRRILESTGYRSAQEYTALINRAHTRYADLLASRKSERASQAAASVASKSEENNPPEDDNREPVLMLDGYCPVTLWKSRRWEKGAARFASEFEGQLFHLESASAKSEFKENPQRYVPQLLGCDAVIVWETDRAVAGSIKWAAFYDEALYLFANAENREQFKKSPDKYIRVQVVLHADQIEPAVR